MLYVMFDLTTSGRLAIGFAAVIATRLLHVLSDRSLSASNNFYLFFENRSGIKWTSSGGMRSIFSSLNNACMSSSSSLISS